MAKTQNRKSEQHIAVFGESGSGKTVLLSSFYGLEQERVSSFGNLYRMNADDQGQGDQLYQNYLRMKNSSMLPQKTKFMNTEYAFTIEPKESHGKKPVGSLDRLHVVWHDYPGEWFEQSPSGDVEAEKRIKTFRRLLTSDVAVLLVDGQRLLDNQGEEERYLKSMFGNVRNGIAALKDDLLSGKKSLSRFPRIWIIALSKSDLLPEMDVSEFRDLLVEKAAGEISELRDLLCEFIDNGEAFELGQDYLLLSSAKFEPGKIETSTRVGVDLMLPLAVTMPLKRMLRWMDRLSLSWDLLKGIFSSALLPLAIALISRRGSLLKNKKKLSVFVAKTMAFKDHKKVQEVLTKTANELEKHFEEAKTAQQYMQAVLTEFLLRLNKGKEERILLESNR